MYLKTACLTAATALSLVASVAHAEDPAGPNGMFGFHPYVSLGSRCEGLDGSLAGIPVPLAAGVPDCAGREAAADIGTDRRPMLLIYNAESGSITGTRPY